MCIRDRAKLYQEAFPKVNSKIVYGSTEAEPISSIGVEELLNTSSSAEDGLLVGNIYSKAEVRIISLEKDSKHEMSALDFESIQQSEGELGEIVVSGAHVLKRYFKNDEAFRENKIIVGDVLWHRTGDSGIKRGKNLWLHGRVKQLIYKNGKYISPFIIEQRLSEIEGVSIGTLLELNSELVLCLETEKEVSFFDFLVEQFDVDRLKCLKKIPRDPRHHSKIDYEKLKRLND